MGAAFEADRRPGHDQDGSYMGSPETKAIIPGGPPIYEVGGNHPVPQELASDRPGPYEMDTTQHNHRY